MTSVLDSRTIGPDLGEGDGPAAALKARRLLAAAEGIPFAPPDDVPVEPLLFTSADYSAGLDLTGKVKFGTADADKGLGTGKNDYGLSLDAYKAYGEWTVFGGVGWMKYGSSDYIRLQNGFNANLGAGFKVSQTDDVGAYYYYREKIAEGGAAQSELTAYWNHKIGADWRLQSYVMGGLADGSPDWGVGATAKYLF